MSTQKRGQTSGSHLADGLECNERQTVIQETAPNETLVDSHVNAKTLWGQVRDAKYESWVLCTKAQLGPSGQVSDMGLVDKYDSTTGYV